jgi:subtilisin family serine protease
MLRRPIEAVASNSSISSWNTFAVMSVTFSATKRVHFAAILVLLLGIHGTSIATAEPTIPVTSSMAMEELTVLAQAWPNAKDLLSAASNRYPVEWVRGQCMVGFVGQWSACSEPQLEQHVQLARAHPDVMVGAVRNGIVSFRVDAYHLEAVEQLGLSYVELASKAKPDLTRLLYGTRVDSVHAGWNLPQAYTGEDVLIGVIDWGFDYTHPMFYDTALVASRIRGIWDQFRQSGPAPVDYAYGTEALTPASIANLASDTANVYSWATHGTHVAGIAGGGGAGIGLLGVAPSAEFLFATFLVDEAAAMDAMAWMQSVAEADDKRLVINMSWGLPQFGTQDGQALINQFIDGLSAEGVIFVSSAGNNGGRDFHIDKTFTGDTLRSRVQFYPQSAHPYMWGQNLTLWGEPGAAFDAGFLLTSSGTNVVEESPWFSTETGPWFLDSTLVHDGDTIVYDLAVEQAHPVNGRPFMRFRIRKGSSSLGVGLQATADEGRLHCWNIVHLSNDVGNWGQDFQSVGGAWTAGDDQYGVGDPACTESVIAVAAYYSEYLNPLGNEGGGTLASFSTIGPTLDDRLKPDLAAPGLSVASSISSFTDGNYNLLTSTEFEGVTYPFAKLSGTSMSSPAVAGVAALLLEADPTLSAAELREILHTTARADDHTGEIPLGGSTTWGMGKVNAYRAVQQVLGLSDLETWRFSAIPSRFELRPNPARDVLWLQHRTPQQFSGAVQWFLRDTQGRILRKGIQTHNAAEISLEGLPSGAMLLEIWEENEPPEVIRFVKL